MGKNAEYIKWEKKFRKDWEVICRQVLGQEKYNATRGLDANKGTKEKTHIPCGGAYGDS